MSSDGKHEMAGAIKEWLLATSDAEIPLGLSTAEACRRARPLLAEIVVGQVHPAQLEMDEYSKDVIWALPEELEQRSRHHLALEDCDRVYRFVSGLCWGNDPFREHADVLRRIAKIGWRSSHKLAAIRKRRSEIWRPGKGDRHDDICRRADELPERIHSLAKNQVALDVGVILELCSEMFQLLNVRPRVVSTAASALYGFLMSQRIGQLDDSQHLKAASSFIASISHRLLGRWDAAASGYDAAATAFRCTVSLEDLERVDVERLGLKYARGEYETVVEEAPGLITTLSLQREKVKAELILAWSLLNLSRPADARARLEETSTNPVVGTEPALQACLLTVLGNTFSLLGMNDLAMAKFVAAGTALASLQHLGQSAMLATAIGEHIGKQGNHTGAAFLYSIARDAYRETGQDQLAGYLSVLLAEMLMIVGRVEQAEAELMAALPIIERFNLRREAVVVVALLREALSKRRMDVKTIQALREQLRRGLP